MKQLKFGCTESINAFLSILKDVSINEYYSLINNVTDYKFAPYFVSTETIIAVNKILRECHYDCVYIVDIKKKCAENNDCKQIEIQKMSIA